MRKGMKWLVLALNLLAAKAALGVGEGDTAPDFTLPVLAEDPARSLSLSETDGKVRYIDFWASWCAPCRVSIPQIIALQEELGGPRFEVIAINVDERVGDALDFLVRYPMNYVNLSDPQGDTAAAYALAGMPMSYVVDAEGRVTMAHVGFNRGDMETIRSHILALLGTQPAEDP